MSKYKTPLRYPGGKQKLAPFIAEIMIANELEGGHYVEPYAGGAGVAIELLLNGIASHIHLNDASRAVYAFWSSILKNTDEFCKRVLSASLTVEEWKRQRNVLRAPTKHKLLDLGFSFFFLNRCNRSGIPNGGVIGGLDQTGKWKIDARFSRNDLINRIEAIAGHRHKISIRNMDAEEFLMDHASSLPKKTLIYCDPPYYQKADRLYLNHYCPDDHKRLARFIRKTVRHPWVVSYDAAPEIMREYKGHESFIYSLQYNAATARQGNEVFFFSDKLELPTQSTVTCIDQGLKPLRAG